MAFNRKPSIVVVRLMFSMLADVLTLSRVAAAAILIWLGLTRGAAALPASVVVTLLAWTTDQLDGWAARRSTAPTRLARFDFVVDLVFYLGILGYLAAARFIPPVLPLALVAALLLSWAVTRRKAVAVFWVRLVDLTAAVVIFTHQPLIGLLIVVWLVVLAAVYRERVARRLPGWFGEMATLLRLRAAKRTKAGSETSFDNTTPGP